MKFMFYLYPLTNYIMIMTMLQKGQLQLFLQENNTNIAWNLLPT